MSRNYYEILEVEDSCDLKIIKSSYRKLAMKYHPDKNPDKDTSSEFREVNEAYIILSDESKRLDYDDSLKSHGHSRYRTYNTSDFSNWESAFENTWGEWFGNQTETKGDDINVIVRLTLEEFNDGCDKIIVEKNGKLKITIQKGTKPNSKLKISGKGEYSLDGGERGDMIINLFPLKHKTFDLLDKGDISLNVELSYPSLILGTKVLVETLSSKIKISIPENTEVGSKMRVKGHGIGESDLVVIIKLYMPKTLNNEEKELISRLSECPNIDKYVKR